MDAAHMKLFAFRGAETDWIAATNEADARRMLRLHYGITEDDIDGSYEVIEEVDPASVEVYPDDWDYEDDEAEPPTAAEFMTKPGFVCSTCH